MEIDNHGESRNTASVAEHGGGRVNRRSFLSRAGTAAVAPAAMAVVGGPLATVASAAAPGHAAAEVAPVPPESLGPAPNAQGYHVGRIRGNLYWVTDSVYISMFLSTTEGVVLVDAPPTIGHNLLRAIADVTRANGRPGKVTHIVYSHSHADHIGAASIFGPGVERIAHEQGLRLLKRDNDPHRPLPTVTFKEHHRLTVGGERLDLSYHGPNESPDNIFVYAPEYKTLMLVDVIFPGWVPFKNLGAAQDIPDWIKAQRIALTYPWQTLVAGHNGRLGTRRDAETQIAYVDDLVASARTVMTHLDPTAFFKRYGDNSWAVFRAYLDAASAQTAEPVVKKYLRTLAGASVFTIDNAYSIFEFAVRVDGGTLGPFGIHP